MLWQLVSKEKPIFCFSKPINHLTFSSPNNKTTPFLCFEDGEKDFKLLTG